MILSICSDVATAMARRPRYGASWPVAAAGKRGRRLPRGRDRVHGWHTRKCRRRRGANSFPQLVRQHLVRQHRRTAGRQLLSPIYGRGSGSSTHSPFLRFRPVPLPLPPCHSPGAADDLKQAVESSPRGTTLHMKVLQAGTIQATKTDPRAPALYRHASDNRCAGNLRVSILRAERPVFIDASPSDCIASRRLAPHTEPASRHPTASRSFEQRRFFPA